MDIHSASTAPTDRDSFRLIFASDRDRRLDGGMRRVGLEGEVLEAESEQVLHRAIEAHAGEGPRRAGELLAGLLEVIEVEVGVAESEDELARLEPCAT